MAPGIGPGLTFVSGVPMLPSAAARWIWPAGLAISPSRCGGGSARCGRWTRSRTWWIWSRPRPPPQAQGNIRPVVSSAESLDAERDYFDLVVIGNAFHRLDRDLVAGRVLRWLKPGG
jgi:Methyltransferase domain